MSSPNAYCDHDQYREVLRSRAKAHAKHGTNSIEAVQSSDPRWLSILGEEFGEVCRALTYDGTSDLRAELIDVLAVASAWVDAIDRSEAPTPPIASSPVGGEQHHA